MKSWFPGPLHGWRAFWGEVGVIVLGVLIALGMQKAAEWAHARDLVSNAQENIRAEVADNLGSLSKREGTQRCLNSRLDEIAKYLQQAEELPASPPPTWIGRPQVWTMSNFRWQTASQGGGTSLLSTEEQSLYADIYVSFLIVDATQNIEQDAWTRLRAIEGQQRLSDATISEMRIALSQARHSNWRIHVAARQTLEQAGKLGILPVKGAFNGSRSVCLAMYTPRSEALRQLASPYGEP